MWEVKVIKLGASVGSREDLKGGKKIPSEGFSRLEGESQETWFKI